MENKFDVGNITVNVKFDINKLKEDIMSVPCINENPDIFVRDNKTICVYGADDFYQFDISDYIIFG